MTLIFNCEHLATLFRWEFWYSFENIFHIRRIKHIFIIWYTIKSKSGSQCECLLCHFQRFPRTGLGITEISCGKSVDSYLCHCGRVIANKDHSKNKQGCFSYCFTTSQNHSRCTVKYCKNHTCETTSRDLHQGSPHKRSKEEFPFLKRIWLSDVSAWFQAWLHG